jgi:hypothetical protein
MSLLIAWNIGKYLYIKNHAVITENYLKLKIESNYRRKLAANQKGVIEKTANGKTIYKYSYTIDKFGRRVTPVKNEKERNKAVLFFVDSFMFGQGVNDNETLPYYCAELMPDTMPYNCASPGLDTHDLLEDLRDERTRDGIKKSRDYACIYLFIDDHVQRVINLPKIDGTAPCYYIDKKGMLKNGRNLFWGNPVTAYIISKLSRSRFSNFIVYSCIYSKGNEKDIYLISRMIEESKNCFKEKFGSDKFIVLFWPGSKYTSVMIPYFNMAGIKYIDYHNLEKFNDNNNGYNFPVDLHPTKIAYKNMAELLVKDIRKYIGN